MKICKVCLAVPDEKEGVLRHHKSCYQLSIDGGGEEYFVTQEAVSGEAGKVEIVGDGKPLSDEAWLRVYTEECNRVVQLTAQIESLQSRLSEAEAVIDRYREDDYWTGSELSDSLLYSPCQNTYAEHREGYEMAHAYRAKYPKESTTSAEGESQDSN